MGYASSNLIRDEQIVHEASRHWFMFLTPLFGIAVGGAFFLVGIFKDDGSGWKEVWCFFGIVLAAISLIGLLDRFIEYISIVFVVTNLRVIAKSGIIRRVIVEQMIPRIDALSINQGFLGRIFGFGSVGISAGGTTQIFRWIADPVALRRKVQECQSDR